MAGGRVAAVFKLNGKGFDLRRGVALLVVMPVSLVVLGVLDQERYFVSGAFGASGMSFRIVRVLRRPS